MKIDRSDYLNLAKAGLLVTIAMSLLLLAAWRLSGVSQTTRDDFLLLLFLPGGLVVMPWIHNIHTSWPGYVFLGVAVNWIFYTWGTWAFMEKRRRKRELRRSKAAANAIPPGLFSSRQLIILRGFLLPTPSGGAPRPRVWKKDTYGDSSPGELPEVWNTCHNLADRKSSKIVS